MHISPMSIIQELRMLFQLRGKMFKNDVTDLSKEKVLRFSLLLIISIIFFALDYIFFDRIISYIARIDVLDMVEVGTILVARLLAMIFLLFFSIPLFNNDAYSDFTGEYLVESLLPQYLYGISEEYRDGTFEVVEHLNSIGNENSTVFVQNYCLRHPLIFYTNMKIVPFFPSQGFYEKFPYDDPDIVIADESKVVEPVLHKYVNDSCEKNVIKIHEPFSCWQAAAREAICSSLKLLIILFVALGTGMPAIMLDSRYSSLTTQEKNDLRVRT